MNSGDVRFWRWRKFVVEALVGASTVAIVFAACIAIGSTVLWLMELKKLVLGLASR